MPVTSLRHPHAENKLDFTILLLPLRSLITLASILPRCVGELPIL